MFISDLSVKEVDLYMSITKIFMNNYKVINTGCYLKTKLEVGYVVRCLNLNCLTQKHFDLVWVVNEP